MDIGIQLSAFDFCLQEILLVHRNTHLPDFRWTQYRTGRKMDGLVFCVQGCALYDFGNETLEVTTGQCLFLPSSCGYVLRAVGNEPFLHYTANFRLTDVRFPGGSDMQALISGRRRYRTDPSRASLYAERMENLLSVWQRGSGGYAVLAKSILNELLYLYFIDVQRSGRSSSDAQKLLPAVRALDQRYREDIPVSELARMCSLSETHFRRLFIAVTGTTPTDYRTHKRILHAKDLLASGLYSISETARETGFSDPSYFSRVFRAHTGLSPGEFRSGL